MNKPIKEGRLILTRVLDALLDSPDAYFPYRGAPAITADGVANWEARQTISRLLRGDVDSVELEAKGDCEDWRKQDAVESLPVVDADAISLEELERLTAPQANLFAEGR